jgi:hypothetical protein
VAVDEVANVSESYPAFIFRMNPEYGGNKNLRNAGNIVLNYAV